TLAPQTASGIRSTPHYSPNSHHVSRPQSLLGLHLKNFNSSPKRMSSPPPSPPTSRSHISTTTVFSTSSIPRPSSPSWPKTLPSRRIPKSPFGKFFLRNTLSPQLPSPLRKISEPQETRNPNLRSTNCGWVRGPLSQLKQIPLKPRR